MSENRHQSQATLRAEHSTSGTPHALYKFRRPARVVNWDPAPISMENTYLQ